MAYVLEVHIVDAGDNTVKVSHEFWGLTERECHTYMREHEASCEYFRAAVKEGRVIEEPIEEIEDDELPDGEEDDFEEEEVG